ncbi:hypothetical protein MUO66_01815, partial [Candidatus Bathyarchaeota archaeon]|nr:hypothetical protein [Candidatus Bathyarchaeota archaeon]
DKESLKKKMAELEQKESEFSEQKRQEELEKLGEERHKKIAQLKEEKNSFKQDLTSAEEKLISITSKISELDNQKQELLIKEGYITEIDYEAEKELTTGIVGIDATIASLKEEKADENKKLELTDKRIALRKDKIRVLEKELDLYETQRNDLFMEENAQEEIELFDEKIAGVNEEIKIEKDKLLQLELTKQLGNKKVGELDAQIEDYMAEYKTEYEKKEGFDRYVTKETKRLQNELAAVADRNAELSEEWKNWATEREALEEKITEYEKEIEVVKGTEISEVVTELAEIEKKEAELLKEETKQLQEKSVKEVEDTTVVKVEGEEEPEELKQLKRKVEEEKTKIAEDELKLAEEKQELLEKKQLATEERAERLSAWSVTIIIIVVVILLALVILFFVGRKFRAKKKSK